MCYFGCIAHFQIVELELNILCAAFVFIMPLHCNHCADARADGICVRWDWQMGERQ